MRIVVVLDAFGPELGAARAAAAVTAGWHAAAPADDLTVPAPGDHGLAAAMDGAGLAVTGGPRFDWEVLRDSLVSTVARAAVERGVPCVVLAGRVSVGRREAAAIGVDAAYAVADGPVTATTLATLAERVARRWGH